MNNVESYLFGVSEFTTKPWSFSQDVERYAQLGVDTIEVCEEKLDPAHCAEQLDQIAAHGLVVSSVQPVVRTLFPSLSQPEPRDLAARMKRFRHTIERCAGAGTQIPFVTNTGIPPKGNIQAVFDAAVKEYRSLAEFAADHGARVALEPLNASIMNEESAIWTLQQALQIVEAVDRPSFGVCLDVWNVWQNAEIIDHIRGSGDRTFVVQCSDWRTPRSFQDRLVVGSGEIPLAPLLRAIYQSGYRGAYSVEIFSGGVPDSIWERDLNAVIQESRAGFERAWQEAFALP